MSISNLIQGAKHISMKISYGYGRICAALFALMLSVGPASAQSIESILSGGSELIRSAISFISILCVIVGLVLIIKGVMLLMDKSKDRGQDVKTSSILIHLGGGAFLTALWLLLRVLLSAFGADEGDVGADIAF